MSPGRGERGPEAWRREGDLPVRRGSADRQASGPASGLTRGPRGTHLLATAARERAGGAGPRVSSWERGLVHHLGGDLRAGCQETWGDSGAGRRGELTRC